MQRKSVLQLVAITMCSLPKIIFLKNYFDEQDIDNQFIIIIIIYN